MLPGSRQISLVGIVADRLILLDSTLIENLEQSRHPVLAVTKMGGRHLPLERIGFFGVDGVNALKSSIFLAF
jgi:hypothetical protein